MKTPLHRGLTKRGCDAPRAGSTIEGASKQQLDKSPPSSDCDMSLATTKRSRQTPAIAGGHRLGSLKKSPAATAGARCLLLPQSRTTPLAGLTVLRRGVAAASASLRRLVGLVHVW